MRNEKIITLKLSAAVAIDGQVVRAGTLVEMIEAEAKDLLRRGKAVLATERDGAAPTADDAGSDAAGSADATQDHAAGPDSAITAASKRRTR